ncbi:MAG TPA: hypothetical protein VJ843_02965 [Candidatus Saccharimonadales bacterium]|nr:hypothetical protein [Candidatus Saccharimonadales bacterium]
MNKLYAFSPITSKGQFDAALKYIVKKSEELSEKLTGTRLSVATVKVFAHYPEEFQFMKGILEEYGTFSTIGRSTSIYVDSALTIDGNQIENVGIRVPDPYRLQAGCVDFRVERPKDFVSSLPKNEYDYIRPFPDMPDDFVELWHPDFDVAGYIPLE